MTWLPVVECGHRRDGMNTSTKFPREERMHADAVWFEIVFVCDGIIRWANEGMGNEGTEEVDDNEGWVIFDETIGSRLDLKSKLNVATN